MILPMSLNHKSIRIASLNVLHNQKNLQERAELIVEELKIIQPDIICFQEVVSKTPFNLVQYVREELGMAGSVIGDHYFNAYNSVYTGNAIISKTPIEGNRSLGQCTTGSPEISSLAITTTVQNKRLEVINSHFMWGGYSEYNRLLQAVHIDKYAHRVKDKHPETLVLLAGDLNTTPESDTIRYLNGQSIFGNKSTLWVDAFDVAGQQNNPYTTRLDNDLSHETARAVGIAYPEMQPQRRIDYIKALGWTYGRTGSPLLCEVWADSTNEEGLSISDHYGLYADFMIL